MKTLSNFGHFLGIYSYTGTIGFANLFLRYRVTLCHLNSFLLENNLVFPYSKNLTKEFIYRVSSLKINENKHQNFYNTRLA